jgi:hypothetical protein
MMMVKVTEEERALEEEKLNKNQWMTVITKVEYIHTNLF